MLRKTLRSLILEMKDETKLKEAERRRKCLKC
jgi:hypothetical protein